MARLVRTAMEARDRKRQLLVLLALLVQLAMLGELEGAAYVLQAVILGCRVAEPTRGSSVP